MRCCTSRARSWHVFKAPVMAQRHTPQWQDDQDPGPDVLPLHAAAPDVKRTWTTTRERGVVTATTRSEVSSCDLRRWAQGRESRENIQHSTSGVQESGSLPGVINPFGYQTFERPDLAAHHSAAQYGLSNRFPAPPAPPQHNNPHPAPPPVQLLGSLPLPSHVQPAGPLPLPSFQPSPLLGCSGQQMCGFSSSAPPQHSNTQSGSASVQPGSPPLPLHVQPARSLPLPSPVQCDVQPPHLSHPNQPTWMHAPQSSSMQSPPPRHQHNSSLTAEQVAKIAANKRAAEERLAKGKEMQISPQGCGQIAVRSPDEIAATLSDVENRAVENARAMGLPVGPVAAHESTTDMRRHINSITSNAAQMGGGFLTRCHKSNSPNGRKGTVAIFICTACEKAGAAGDKLFTLRYEWSYSGWVLYGCKLQHCGHDFLTSQAEVTTV